MLFFSKTALFVPGKSTCSLPPRRGRCRALLEAFFFDEQSGTCKKFAFGGCGETQVTFYPKPTYRFPRVFGDKFGDEFGESPNFVTKFVTYLVTILVNHCIW